MKTDDEVIVVVPEVVLNTAERMADLVRAHDVWYQYSEDYSIYNRGSAQRAQLWSVANEINLVLDSEYGSAILIEMLRAKKARKKIIVTESLDILGDL